MYVDYVLWGLRLRSWRRRRLSSALARIFMISLLERYDIPARSSSVIKSFQSDGRRRLLASASIDDGGGFDGRISDSGGFIGYLFGSPLRL
jgi:hypothetical protein